jgi:cytoskeletal protein RodZ
LGPDKGKSEVPKRKAQNHSENMTHRTHHQSLAMQMPLVSPVAWLNAALILIAVASFLFYVVTANGLAAQEWRFADAHDTLSGLLEERNGLVAQQSELEDRSVLSTLAAQAGMVPAGAVVYLVQDQSVAVR